LSYKKVLTKTMLFFAILLTFLSGSFLPIIGSIYNTANPSLSTAYDKVHKGFLLKSDSLEALLGSDSFQIELKGGKVYYFSFKVDNSIGASITVALTGGLPGHADIGTWDADDPKSMRRITFLYTPDTTEVYTLLILKIVPIDNAETDYTVYVNRQGFVGYWWIILAGLGGVLVLIIILVAVRSATKKKPKRRKRKK
jgi:hypothetical protein